MQCDANPFEGSEPLKKKMLSILFMLLKPSQAATIPESGDTNYFVFPLVFASNQLVIPGFQRMTSGELMPFFANLKTSCDSDYVDLSDGTVNQQFIWGSLSYASKDLNLDSTTASVQNKKLRMSGNPSVAKMCMKSTNSRDDHFSQLLAKVDRKIVSIWMDTSLPFISENNPRKVTGEMIIGGIDPRRLDQTNSQVFRLSSDLYAPFWETNPTIPIRIGTHVYPNLKLIFAPEYRNSMVPARMFDEITDGLKSQLHNSLQYSSNMPNDLCGMIFQFADETIDRFDCIDAPKLKPIKIGSLTISPTSMFTKSGDGICQLTIRKACDDEPEFLMGLDLIRHYHFAIRFGGEAGNSVQIAKRKIGSSRRSIVAAA